MKFYFIHEIYDCLESNRKKDQLDKKKPDQKFQKETGINFSHDYSKIQSEKEGGKKGPKSDLRIVYMIAKEKKNSIKVK